MGEAPKKKRGLLRRSVGAVGRGSAKVIGTTAKVTAKGTGKVAKVTAKGAGKATVVAVFKISTSSWTTSRMTSPTCAIGWSISASRFIRCGHAVHCSGHRVWWTPVVAIAVMMAGWLPTSMTHKCENGDGTTRERRLRGRSRLGLHLHHMTVDDAAAIAHPLQEADGVIMTPHSLVALTNGLSPLALKAAALALLWTAAICMTSSTAWSPPRS